MGRISLPRSRYIRSKRAIITAVIEEMMQDGGRFMIMKGGVWVERVGFGSDTTLVRNMIQERFNKRKLLPPFPAPLLQLQAIGDEDEQHDDDNDRTVDAEEAHDLPIAPHQPDHDAGVAPDDRIENDDGPEAELSVALSSVFSSVLQSVDSSQAVSDQILKDTVSDSSSQESYETPQYYQARAPTVCNQLQQVPPACIEKAQIMTARKPEHNANTIVAESNATGQGSEFVNCAVTTGNEKEARNNNLINKAAAGDDAIPVSSELIGTFTVSNLSMEVFGSIDEHAGLDVSEKRIRSGNTVHSTEPPATKTRISALGSANTEQSKNLATEKRGVTAYSSACLCVISSRQAHENDAMWREFPAVESALVADIDAEDGQSSGNTYPLTQASQICRIFGGAVANTSEPKHRTADKAGIASESPMTVMLDGMSLIDEAKQFKGCSQVVADRVGELKEEHRSERQHFQTTGRKGGIVPHAKSGSLANLEIAVKPSDMSTVINGLGQVGSISAERMLSELSESSQNRKKIRLLLEELSDRAFYNEDRQLKGQDILDNAAGALSVVMGEHPNDPGVLCEVFNFASQLYGNNEHYSIQVSHDFLKQTIRILLARPDCEILLLHGLSLLRTFSTIAPESRKVITKENGIELILCGMHRHFNHVGIQQKGCELLGDLASDNFENRGIIAASDGTDLILRAMQQHEHDGIVQDFGRWTLHYLAEYEENQRALIAAFSR